MYNIDIKSKQQCIIFSTRDLKEDCVIISINCPGETTKIFNNKNILDICTLQFDDIEEQIDDLVLMTNEQAKKIKIFIDKYKDKVNNIVIHCAAGISRSAAVGCVIARYLNKTDDYLWQTGNFTPNKHVYRIMCKEFNIEFNEKEFNIKNKIKYKKDKLNNLINYSNYGISEDDMFCDVIIEKD